MSYSKEYQFCLRCGRRLKTPENRKRGMGETCWNKSNVLHHTKLLFNNGNTVSFSNNKGTWYFTSQEALKTYINKDGEFSMETRGKVVK